MSKQNKKDNIKVIYPNENSEMLSDTDMEMDKRAIQAVKSAIEMAKSCNNPIAYYDPMLKRAYVEYPNGDKQYIEQYKDERM